MKAWQKGLTLQHRYLGHKELLAFCSDHMVSVDTLPWEKEIYRFIIHWLSEADHVVQFSSGTTGKSKEIRLSKHAMMASALNTNRFFSLDQGQTALLCMPVDYIAGKMMIVRSLVSNLNLLLTPPKSLPEIPASGVDFSAMVPLQVNHLADCGSDLNRIRKLLVGGAEISRDIELIARKLNTQVYATFGMAETCSHIALKRLNGPDRQTAYHALPGIKLDSDGRGCLVIEADYLPQPVVTNDLVTLHHDGSFTWLGRYDNLINSGGVKIVPEEVEAMIMDKTMLECTVVGVPDEKLGQRLVFVFEKDQAPDSLSSLKTDFENHLPRLWRPKEIVCVEKIPRNEAMKVDRRKLSGLLINQQH